MTNYPKVNFIGNKEKISEWITENIPKDVSTIFDAFSGGASTAYEFKKRGLRVIANDIMITNYMIAKAIIENKKITLPISELEKIISGNPKKGFMHENYSNKLFYSNECEELDRYWENIQSIKDEYKQAIAYTLIRRAMIRKMPYSRFNVPWEKIKQLRDENYSYRKYGRKRAYHNQSFSDHILENLADYNNAIFDNKQDNLALNLNVFDAIKKVNADAIYLDPPYTGTMNNYFGFYGPIDEFIQNKKLEPFTENFVSKSESVKLFEKLFDHLRKYKYWIISYNNSSYPNKETLLNILNKYSKNVKVIEKKHNYQTTGKENKNANKEYLFIVNNSSNI